MGLLYSHVSTDPTPPHGAGYCCSICLSWRSHAPPSLEALLPEPANASRGCVTRPWRHLRAARPCSDTHTHTHTHWPPPCVRVVMPPKPSSAAGAPGPPTPAQWMRGPWGMHAGVRLWPITRGARMQESGCGPSPVGHACRGQAVAHHPWGMRAGVRLWPITCGACRGPGQFGLCACCWPLWAPCSAGSTARSSRE